MIRTIVVLIKSDPQKTHKPVEAVRIALGLLSGDHQVNIVLMDQAPRLLGEDPEDLVDGDILAKYMPSLVEMEQKFYVEEAAWRSLGIESVEAKIESVSTAGIGRMIEDADILVSF